MQTSIPHESPHNDGLLEFRRALTTLYGRRLARAVLYGSRARGDAQEDSDYDVAVFLEPMEDRVGEVFALADMTTDIIRDFGIVIHAVPFRAGSYTERTPIMHEIRKDGRDL